MKTQNFFVRDELLFVEISGVLVASDLFQTGFNYGFVFVVILI